LKKLILVAGAVGLLLTASAAPAKNVTVDISRLGFVPTAVTVQTGDTITFTNKDTVNHQAVCATCPFTSPVLAPGQTFVSPAFTKVGKFNVVDPLNKNKKVTVTVKAAPVALAVTASPGQLNYGATITVAGSLSTGQANQKVDVLAQPCGENAAKVVGTVTTSTGGSFTYQTQPALTTSYLVRHKPATGATVTSPAVSASVRPVVTLTRIKLHRFSVQVVAAQSFVGKAVVIQRWVAVKHRWSRVKTVFFSTRSPASTPLAGSTVSSTRFTANLRRGFRLRAVVPSGQAAPCYLAGSSASIRS
jgi:plastocyanin